MLSISLLVNAIITLGLVQAAGRLLPATITAFPVASLQVGADAQATLKPGWMPGGLFLRY